jgi:hypothetical protein
VEAIYPYKLEKKEEVIGILYHDTGLMFVTSLNEAKHSLVDTSKMT